MEKGTIYILHKKEAYLGQQRRTGRRPKAFFRKPYFAVAKSCVPDCSD